MTATAFHKKWNGRYIGEPSGELSNELSNDLDKVFGDYQFLFFENEVIIPIAFNSNKNPKLIVIKVCLGGEE